MSEVLDTPHIANPYCKHGDIHAFCPYSPEQEAFSASPAFETFFGGAAGPGKTVMLLHEGLRQIHNRGYRAVFFRRTYDELRQVIEMSQESFPLYGGRYNKSEHLWRFPLRAKAKVPEILRGRRPGATYTLAYCDADQDRFRYQGGAWAYIAWDELTQYGTDLVYTYLFLRCRPLVQGLDVECYIRAGSNPGGPGHWWVKERFIDYAPPGEVREVVVEDPLTGKKLRYTRQFIPAVLDSNDILMNTTNYEVALLSYPDPEIRRAMRHGDWNIAAGLMFSELRDGVHRIAAEEPDPSQQHEITVDWGFEAYAVAGWFQTTSGILDGVPHSTQYRELVINKTPPPLFARMLVERTTRAERIQRVTIDSAAWATPQDGGPSPAEQMLPTFQQAGWKVAPATKGAGSRVRGWHLLHTYFFPLRRGGPLLRLMDNCPVTWRQLTGVPRGEHPHDPEEIDRKFVEDDALDMIRYFVQGRPQPAPPTAEELLVADPDLDYAIDVRTYQARQMERYKKAGFPAVKVARRTQPRRHAWTPGSPS